MGQIIGPSAQQIIAQIVGGAPETLDTLNEIAAAIDDNGSYAASVQNALNAKAPLNSPTFTGNVNFTGATVSGISSYSAPTLGSTSIASGATVGTIAGLTLSNPTVTATVATVNNILTGNDIGPFTGIGASTLWNYARSDGVATPYDGSYNPTTNSVTVKYNSSAPLYFYIANLTGGTALSVLSGRSDTDRGLGGVSSSTVGGVTTVTVSLNSYSSFVNVSNPNNIGIIIQNNLGQFIKPFKPNYQATTSTVSDVEISYLDGVTSNIQTQLNNKAGLSGETLTNTTLSGTTKFEQILEKATVSATDATGTINYDLLTNGSVTYYTSNASANWTLNVRGNSGTTLNSLMSIGQSLTIAFLVTNGATARYQTALQIDGGAVSPKWQGGSAPTSGNANSIDVYSITIIKTGDAAFTALESQTRFA